jgi:DNA-binding PadR family transcriptional regulator
MKDIQSLSSGRVRLTTGTLYGALGRLLDEGWIERFEQADTSRDKQAYRLTPIGHRRLEGELDRMKQLVRITSSRLKGVEALR